MMACNLLSSVHNFAPHDHALLLLARVNFSTLITSSGCWRNVASLLFIMLFASLLFVHACWEQVRARGIVISGRSIRMKDAKKSRSTSYPCFDRTILFHCSHLGTLTEPNCLISLDMHTSRRFNDTSAAGHHMKPKH